MYSVLCWSSDTSFKIAPSSDRFLRAVVHVHIETPFHHHPPEGWAPIPFLFFLYHAWAMTSFFLRLVFLPIKEIARVLVAGSIHLSFDFAGSAGQTLGAGHGMEKDLVWIASILEILKLINVQSLVEETRLVHKKIHILGQFCIHPVITSLRPLVDDYCKNDSVNFYILNHTGYSVSISNVFFPQLLDIYLNVSWTLFVYITLWSLPSSISMQLKDSERSLSLITGPQEDSSHTTAYSCCQKSESFLSKTSHSSKSWIV